MIDQTLRDADGKMEKAVEHTREEFAAIRTGRAHPAMFAQITAEYYGQQTPLNQLAGFQVPEPRTVVIQPYDAGAVSCRLSPVPEESPMADIPADRSESSFEDFKHPYTRAQAVVDRIIEGLA